MYNLPGHSSQRKPDFDSVVASVARIALRNQRLDLIRDHERDSQTLDRIGDSFGRILDKRMLAIWFFCRGIVYDRNTEGVDVAYIGSARFNSY